MENGNQPTQQEVPTFTPGVANAPQPAPEPQGEQPVEQQPQPTQQPQEAQPTQGQEVQPTQGQEVQPVQQPAQQPTVNYDEYLDSLIAQNTPQQEVKIPSAPTQEQLENDDQALTKFFGELVDTAVAKALNEGAKQTTIREAEARAWDDVFTKYPEIKESKGLRDTIHNIRIGAYQRGQALSPVQVADQLIGSLHEEYKKGVNDTNVQTTVRQSQPIGGGTQPPQTDPVNLSKLHDGGDAAAVEELTKLIQQGKI